MFSSKGRLLYTNFIRLCSSSSGGGSNAEAQQGEQLIEKVLKTKFPQAKVQVQDISGGCGAMYEVFVEANEFKGLSILKQHKLITETLKTEIKNMHGVRIHTNVLDDN